MDLLSGPRQTGMGDGKCVRSAAVTSRGIYFSLLLVSSLLATSQGFRVRTLTRGQRALTSTRSGEVRLSAYTPSGQRRVLTTTSMRGGFPSNGTSSSAVSSIFEVPVEYFHDRHLLHEDDVVPYPPLQVVEEPSRDGLLMSAILPVPTSSVIDTSTTTAPSTSVALASTQAAQVDPQLINQARLLLLGASALYGTNFSIVKLMGESSNLPAGLGAMLRFGLAALATSPWLWLSTTDDESSSSSSTCDIATQVGAIVAGFEVGLWNSVGYVAQAVGLETTPASNSAFLCSLAVVIVPILDWISGKQLLPKQMTGVLLAIFGVAFLELSDVSSTADLLQLSAGDVASLFQPVAFGIGFWRMESAMQHYQNQAHRCTAAQLLAVFLGSAAYCWFAEPDSLTNWSQFGLWHDPMIWAMLFWTGVITTALTVYMETVALKTLSAAETTLIFSAEPVCGSACAALLLGERFGLNAFAGALLILLGCIVSNLGLDGIAKALLGSSSASSSSSQQTRPSSSSVSLKKNKIQPKNTITVRE